MAHEIDYVVKGDDMQALIVTLDPGEAVHAEAGALLYLEDGILMETSTQGGLMKGLKRAIVGESFFITTFENQGRQRRDAAFAAPYPGKIIPLDLGQTGTWLCQRDGYLCSAYGIEISIAFQKRLGAGLFGGEGFILQRLAGDGLAFIHAGGTVLERDLQVGETLRVDTGCLVAFQESVDYDIQFIGGFKNALFGGEGLFFALLKGPGKVFLQTLPFSRLADRIIKASSLAPGGGRDESRGLGGLGGGLLKGLISGDRS
ncbi:TIGR00266 family protein [bacterium]|nr:TIGR00266 family protein [bacterium]